MDSSYDGFCPSNPYPKESRMSKKSKPMTATDASRIQSAESKSSDGKVAKGSFAARAQAAADSNAKPSK